eukprot:SM000232S07946  [mRNA]  locus=s232:197814:199373:- [translate_table: standard]
MRLGCSLDALLWPAGAPVEAYFKAEAPHRPLKPSRSEMEDIVNTTFDAPNIPPELKKYEALKAAGLPPFPEDSPPEAQEEHVENQYYSSRSKDESHHATGTGFIHMDKMNTDFVLADGKVQPAPHGTGNPATNDWIPAPEEFAYASVKPARSDI